MAVDIQRKHDPGDAVRRAPLWRDARFRSIIYQLITLLLFALFVAYIVHNTLTNLQRQGIASGFRFLGTTAGFDIGFTLIDYSAVSTYGRAFWVGLLNTLLVSAIGIVLATIVGFIIGIARLSTNWLVARLATVYIETVRNIPLLLQLLFWYFAVLQALPHPRDSLGDRRDGLPQQPRPERAAGGVRGRGRRGPDRLRGRGRRGRAAGALGQAPARGDRAAVPHRAGVARAADRAAAADLRRARRAGHVRVPRDGPLPAPGRADAGARVRGAARRAHDLHRGVHRRDRRAAASSRSAMARSRRRPRSACTARRRCGWW